MVFLPNIFCVSGAQSTLRNITDILPELFKKASCSNGEQNKGVTYSCKNPMSAFVSIAPPPPLFSAKVSTGSDPLFYVYK